ncbi:ATP-binding cassette domain-containing protein [Micromonospora sp. WMMD714]|uniref:ATP-binding cassette domain-containing protein n=1 Tax=Micromonospora sp. WMMD714 TaxID=3016097 RepID=UPI00249A6D05|nr:ATP-binding cassette domain-containing protein [Micromonospora sp. WMMD714]WFE62024.1 ATP-binding cassette domain-containing protein [Micromonospora sp. WMMD714]
MVGPSGAGKSSLPAVAGGLGVPTSGSVRMAGRDMAVAGRRGRTTLRRETVGFVFQSGNLLPALAEPSGRLHEQLRAPFVEALAEHGAPAPAGTAELIQAIVYTASHMIENGVGEAKARSLARGLLEPYLRQPTG